MDIRDAIARVLSSKDAVALVLSVLAFLVAFYGIPERRNAARRLERIRLSEIFW
jgi:hypothetical protein